MSFPRHSAAHRRAGLTPFVGLFLMSACTVPDGQSAGGLLGHRSGPDPALLVIESTWPGLDHQRGEIALAGAIDETLTAELHLRAGPKALAGVDARITAPRSETATIDPAAIKMYRLHAVRIPPQGRWPGWHVGHIDPSRRRTEVFDALVPVDAPHGGLPTAIDAGQTLHVLVELHIGRDVAPGVYQSDIEFRQDGNPLVTVPLHVTVWPFLLPGRNECTLLAELDHQELFRQEVRVGGEPYRPRRLSADPSLAGRLEGLLADTIRLLTAHGVTPVLDRVYPIVKVDRGMGADVSWEDFDRTVGSYYDGTLAPAARPPAWCRIPFDEGFPSPREPGGESPSFHEPFLQSYLEECGEHFQQRGWLDRAYVEVPDVAVADATGGQDPGELIALLREAVPQTPVMLRWAPRNPSSGTWGEVVGEEVAQLVDIWCPPAQFCDPLTAAKTGQTWLRVDRPPYSGTLSLLAPETFARVIPWQARRYGMKTVYLGSAVHWPEDEETALPQQCAAFDPSVLLYPGRPFGLSHPLPTMRLKSLRRGLQDLAYLKLLEARGLDHVVQVMLDALSPYALTDAQGHHYADPRPCGWAQDRETWDLARRVMADEVLREMGYADDQPGGRAAMDVRWRQLMDRGRQVDMEVEGVRVRPTRQVGVSRVECTVMLENRLRTPLGGGLSYADLPMGWSVSEPEVLVAAIEPMGRRRVTLTATATNIAWNADGITALPLRLRTDDGRTYGSTARLSYLASVRRRDPVEIDGDLSDWPAGGGNVASDFVPIARPPLATRSGGAGAESTAEVTDLLSEPPFKASALPAAHRTFALVQHDDKYVYLAIVCASGRLSSVDTATCRNVVTYDDMLPVDEEMVEILIDPTNTGTHDTGDLYHLVIKRGAAVFERGIGTDPPTGAHGLWPADVRYATRPTARGWNVEVRIPRDAFDGAGQGPQVWGINFTRLDMEGQVYSTWSGAARHAYDPMSLGNLMLPD